MNRPLATKLRRIAIASAATLVLIFVTTIVDLRAGGRPVAVGAESPAVRALTSHLVLVVVDGLRFDVGSDSKRAPNFARHMRDDAHGEIWAGHVTMTSAAILSMGTGRRGEFAQVVFNLRTSRTRWDDVFHEARATGVRTGVVGDAGWVETFGDFDAQWTDPSGVPLEVDYTDDALDAARRIALSEPRPGIMVVHLAAIDHLAHAFGGQSERYFAALENLDGRLDAFLRALPPDTTVVALSDHGALPNGNHGLDSPDERRSPIFAYGPGIRRAAALPQLSQNDLAATIAVLLGVSGPAHGIGTAMTELLDVTPAEAASIACADARRVARMADALHHDRFVRDAEPDLSTCTGSAPAEARFEAGRRVVRAFDASLEAHKSRGGLAAEIGVGAALLLFLVFAALTVARGKPAVLGVGVGVALVVIGIALTWVVDHAHPPWNESRSIIVALSNVTLLLAAIAPAFVVRAWTRARVASLAVLPGILFLAFPGNAKLHSIVALVGVALVWVLRPHADAKPPHALASGARSLGVARIVAMIVGLAALCWFAAGGDVPAHFRWTNLQLPISLALIAAWILVGARSRDESWRSVDVLLAVAIACAVPLLRHTTPWPLGVAAIVALPAGALLAATAGRRTLACGLGFGAYALVGRDVELMAVGGALVVLEGVAACAAAKDDDPPMPWSARTFSIATLVLALFAASYLARIGLQQGIDFPGAVDPLAGAFDDPSPSMIRVAACILWKYVAVEALLLYVALRALGALRTPVALLFLVFTVGRAASLALTLFVSRASFWTSMRELSDLPCALLMGIAAVGALLVVARLEGAKGAAVAPAIARPAKEEQTTEAALV